MAATEAQAQYVAMEPKTDSTEAAQTTPGAGEAAAGGSTQAQDGSAASYVWLTAMGKALQAQNALELADTELPARLKAAAATLRGMRARTVAGGAE